MEKLFEVRFENLSEDRVFLISACADSLWRQLEDLLAKVEDVDQFDTLTLKPLEFTVDRDVLENSVALRPSSKRSSKFVKRGNHKNVLL